MNKITKAVAVLAFFGCAWAGNAKAATVDFEAYPNGSLGTNVLATPHATFTSGDDLFNLSGVYFTGSGGAICGRTVAQGCASDLMVNFTLAVSNLSFQSVGWAPGDSVVVSIFNGLTNLGSVNVTGDALFNLAGYGLITSLFFDDQSVLFQNFGVGYGEFNFNVGPSPVPIPAALPLLAAGLGAMGFMGWRRKRPAST